MRTTIVLESPSQKLQHVVALLAIGAFALLLWAALTPAPAEPSPAGQTPAPVADRVQPSATSTGTATPAPAAGPPPLQRETVRMVGWTDAFTLHMSVEKQSFIPGEAGLALLRFTNGSASPVMFERADVSVLSQAGRNVTGWYDLPVVSQAVLVAPGESISRTMLFQAPTGNFTAAYELVGSVHYRLGTGSGRVVAGPIGMAVMPSANAQRLSLSLQTNSEGWQLEAVDEQGRPPAVELFGIFQAAPVRGSGYQLFLPSTPDGRWSGRWADHEGPAPSRVAVLLGGRGVVAASLMQGVGPQPTPAEAWRRLHFDTIEEAQTVLPFAIRRPGWLPNRAMLRAVQVFTTTSALDLAAAGPRRDPAALLMYVLRDGTGFTIHQARLLGADDDPVSVARDYPGLAPIAINGQPGVAIEEAQGRTSIRWTDDSRYSFSIRERSPALTLKILVKIAESMQ